jgi:hypothetical protein
MPALSYYTNVHNTALVVLNRKGYRIWTEEGGRVICAERQGWDFRARDPVQLLGLISIFEYHQPEAYKESWWKIDEPWLYESVPAARPNYLPVWSRNSNNEQG